MAEPIPNKDFTDGRLIRRHPLTNELTDMAQTRERIIRTPVNLVPLLDTTTSLGWHDSNRNYCINHGERNPTNLIFITLAGGGTLELDGVMYRIVPGTMTIIPNNVKTIYYTSPDEDHWEFYWMHVRGVNVSNILRRLYQSHNYMIQLKDPSVYTGIFEDILYSPLEGNAQAIYNSRKISELLHLFVEEIIAGRILISDNNNFVKTILQYMEANYMTNIYVHLHSCGDIMDRVDDLVDIGIDALNPLEVKAGMKPLELKEKYGDKLVFHGGINAVLWDDKDAIIEEIRKYVPKMKENGGYIFSSDHSIPNSVSFENFKAIVDEVKRCGTY